MYNSNVLKNFLLVISLFFLIGSFFYIGISLFLIFKSYPIHTLSISNYLGIFFNLFVLIFEFITAIYGIFLLIHTALVFTKTNHLEYDGKLVSQPLVTLIIPSFNPNIYAMETNILNIKNLSYKNIEVYITDNSDNLEIINQLNILCQKYKINFVHRDGLRGFKAGNLNNVLEKIRGEYFIIIDIDQSLKEQAIQKFLFHFENSHNDKLAFIQGRFEIKNTNSVIRTSIAILYTFFYDVISLAKSYRKSVLFNGSSACFRTEIVKSVRGFPENCYTEDIAISNILLLNGFESIYLNDSVTTALVPWKLSTLLSSFWRWSHGGTSCLNLYGFNIVKSKKISSSKKLELLLNNISFIAISSILIIIFSMLFMYWLKIVIVRPAIKVDGILIPLYLIFPIFTSINHLINCIIGMWESKTLHRFLYLIPYSIASIAISIFVVIPTYYALLGIKGPNSPNSRWNRKFSYKRVFSFLIITFGIFSYSFYDSFILNNPLWVSFLSMTIISVLTFFFLLKDFRINVEKAENEYFINFRQINRLNE